MKTVALICFIHVQVSTCTTTLVCIVLVYILNSTHFTKVICGASDASAENVSNESSNLNQWINKNISERLKLREGSQN